MMLQDAEGMGPKRRKLQGSSGETARKLAAQKKKQPKPPPKKKKNRLGQRARKLLAGAPQGGVPSPQVWQPSKTMQTPPLQFGARPPAASWYNDVSRGVV